MARPGLWDELQKLNLMAQARTICLGDGSDASKAGQVEKLLRDHNSAFNVTPRAVFIVRGRFEEDAVIEASIPKEKGKASKKRNAPPTSPPPKTPDPKFDSKPKGRRGPPYGNKNALGNRGGPGAPFGHDRSTKTGLHRNPLLHGVSPHRAALVRVDEDTSPAEILRRSIEVYQLSINDMTREIEAIMRSRSRMWVLGTTYTRQEGDGELMGTGRISQRKRVPKTEALRLMIDARSKVQAKLDSASEKLHKMQQDSEGNRKKGIADALAAMEADSGDDE